MALARLDELGGSTAAAEIQEHFDQVTQSIADVDRRAANIRAGYVSRLPTTPLLCLVLRSRRWATIAAHEP
jgi:hypothetical protein